MVREGKGAAVLLPELPGQWVPSRGVLPPLAKPVPGCRDPLGWGMHKRPASDAAALKSVI